MRSIQLVLLACLFSAALALIDATARPAPPKLAFFCEVDPATIPSISTPAVLSALKAMNATVNIAIRDFSLARTNYIRLLNQNNITTSAWLVLNYTDGYWANINNANKVAQFYLNFYNWTRQNSLKWSAVGLDMEFDFTEIAGLATGDLSSFIAAIYGRLSYPQVLDAARATYNSLVAQIKAHGYKTESYIFPIMYDERLSTRPLLELMFGTVDVRTTDLEIPMLYSSGIPNGLGFMKSYGSTPQAIAIGSAGGDPLQASNNFTKIYHNWSEMERDLLYTYQQLTRNIYIYSLPGVVSNGWLNNIVQLNWSKSLSLADRLTFEFQAINVTFSRIELIDLLLTPNAPLLLTLTGSLATILMSSLISSALSSSTWDSALKTFFQPIQSFGNFL